MGCFMTPCMHLALTPCMHFRRDPLVGFFLSLVAPDDLSL